MRTCDLVIGYSIVSYIAVGTIGAFAKSKSMREVTTNFVMFAIAPLWLPFLAWYSLCLATSVPFRFLARKAGGNPPELPAIREIISFVVDR